MSAPKNAIPLRKEEPIDPVSPSFYWAPVECECGWKGELGDLLCDPDDPDPPENDLWCPQCKTKGWYWV